MEYNVWSKSPYKKSKKRIVAIPSFLCIKKKSKQPSTNCRSLGGGRGKSWANTSDKEITRLLSLRAIILTFYSPGGEHLKYLPIFTDVYRDQTKYLESIKCSPLTGKREPAGSALKSAPLAFIPRKQIMLSEGPELTFFTCSGEK